MEMRSVYKTFVGKPEGKNHLEDLDIDGRIIFKWIIEKFGLRVWIDIMWLGIGTRLL
jgi:hypothetical protein